MRKEIEILLTPKQAADPTEWKHLFALSLNIPVEGITHLRPLQRSIDARGKKVKIRIKAELFIDEPAENIQQLASKHYPDVSKKTPVIIVGTGPAGLFAALTLIEQGIKPILLERGKEVQSRKTDIALLNREHKVNPDSNYCFGEGGAGTYSDGKLYTRSSKRGNVGDILATFVEHGASTDILIDSHAHIGTDKLPAIVAAIRKTILDAGGEMHFNCRVCDFLIHDHTITGVEDQSGNRYEGRAVILASGHSARDIYELLQRKNVVLEAKSFALGVRAEHPQELIDSIQYHQAPPRDPLLPAATYNLVKQVDGRGVFSFCMCPGGIIVPAATAAEQLVVNGMSTSRRNSPFANSGIVVSVEPGDFAHLSAFGPLAGLEFQRQIEESCWRAGGMSQTAPAQRITDFVRGRISRSLPPTSYFPGITAVALNELLPTFIADRLQKAFVLFDQPMRGYYSSEGVILGTESRTSSPVRIPRDAVTFEQHQIKQLYPCGEGAGYAGGIVSSAMDGVNCARAVASKCNG